MVRRHFVPPPTAERLAGWALQGEERSVRLGDLEERFHYITRERGARRARGWYRRQALRLTALAASQHILWSSIMLRKNLIMAWRSIRRSKAYAALNIFGLAAGMACCIFLLIWVRDERSYDAYHKNAGRIARVYMEFAGGTSKYSAYAGPRTSLMLKEAFPEIEEGMRFRILGSIKPTILVKAGPRAFNEPKVVFADASLFRIFDHEFSAGSPRDPLPTTGSVVITESIARKYFGAENPVGRTLSLENAFDFTVSAVIKDVPRNSHLQFDLLVPFENIEKILTYYGSFVKSNGGPWLIKNYLLLKESASLPALQKKVLNFYDKVFAGGRATVNKVYLQPLKDIHLFSSHIRDLDKRGDILYVRLFTIAGLLILLIACVNFVNLTTAQSAKRFKEIGMRKVCGATRRNLVRQLFGETILFSLSALLLAVAFVAVLLPAFNNLTGKQMPLRSLLDPLVAAGILGIAVLAGLLSGSYPALYFSSLHPLRILKAAHGSEKGGVVFRKVTVVLQFVTTVSLIVGSLVIVRQFRYMQTKDLGFDRESFIYFPLYGRIKDRADAVQAELSKNPNILASSLSSSIMSQGSYATDYLDWEGKDRDAAKDFRMSFVSVSREYIETFRLSMAEGTSFAKNPPRPDNEEVIVNETAARLIGAKRIVGLGAIVPGGPKTGRIIGVVKDYNFSSLHKDIAPLVMSVEPAVFRYFLVKIRPGNIAATVESVKRACQAVEPGFPFEFRFMDEAFDLLYDRERRMRNILSVFSVIAITLSCLGLVGLASHTAQMRTREIGIRKVLGASTLDILELLTSEYTALIALSNLIAWPVSFFLMSGWLQSFAFRTKLSPLIFLAAGLASLLLAWASVGWRTVKASLANPVGSLRNE
jgi:putative ABC transport system permease protein